MNLENFKKWPHFEQDEIESVVEVLRSAKVNRWTGSKNTDFEKQMCEKFGAQYSIALMNGTVALELALEAFGIGSGDEVITTCRTFMASASAVVMRGAKPVIADVDINSQNITAETIKPLISSRTKAIIVVHLAGWPCEMDEIMQLAKAHNLFVIEDCAQAHGAMYNGKNVGTIGHIGAWSFCQDKIMTTCGEGGAITTNDESLWYKMWAFKDHGKDFDTVFSKNHPAGFRWMINSFGTNWRMTEMQAAQGIVALGKLDKWVDIRRKHAKKMTSLLEKFSCMRVTLPPKHIKHSYYKYYCFVRPENLKDGWSRDRIIDEISKEKIPCMTGSCWNIANEKCFTEKGWGKTEKELPNAFALRDTALMFLVHPTLTDSDMDHACEVIGKVLSAANR